MMLQEMKALSAARAGLQPSASLLESFEGTKGALSSGKTSRGIREKLASEAAPAAKSGGLFGSNTPKLASPVAAAPRPSMFSASAPKPSAPKPAAPKPAATAAAGGSSGGSIVSGPLIQAVGVLGLVGVGASVASNAATSKVKTTLLGRYLYLLFWKPYCHTTCRAQCCSRMDTFMAQFCGCMPRC